MTKKDTKIDKSKVGKAKKKIDNRNATAKASGRRACIINERQRKLADLFLTGKYTYAQCYEKAGYSCATWSDQNKSGRCHAILNTPVVTAYLDEKRAELSKKLVWTRDRAMRSLVKVAEETEELGFGGGNQIVRAVEAANKMCGFDKPEEVLAEDRPKWQLPASLLGSAFVDINRAIDDEDYWDIMLEGGRGSLKSSYAALKVIELIEQHPTWCAIAIRKVSNTINDSVFANLVWAIDIAGLVEDYKCTKSPHQITKKSTGQVIYFRGADDPGKIKSIKPPKDMYIAVQWMEEFDQMDGMESVRNIEQSITRGGDRIVRIKSYNTPKSALHFVNVEKLIPKKGRTLHKSTYLQSPIKWLGRPFVEEAEHLKSVNTPAYDHEYMGVAIGEDGMVFDNWEVREITAAERETLNVEMQGLDWGWYPDPFAWVSCYYNAATMTLYVTDEYGTNKMKNEQTYNALKDAGRLKPHVQIICDSAEPKSIQDFKDYGAYARPCIKFPGSVERGLKWLASRAKIVIDVNCPRIAKEIREYELEKDKDDNYISVFPDKNNHFIDALRYATNDIWKQRGTK